MTVTSALPTRRSRLVVSIGSLLLVLSSLYLVAPTRATQGESHKTTICHATHSETNPYVQISVDNAAIDGDKNNDHSHHTGPIWHAGAKAAGVDWGDIIPPVAGVNPGQNWTTEGQAIYNANCAVGQGTGVCIPSSAYSDAELRDMLKEAGSGVLDPQIATGSAATTWDATVVVPAELCDVQVSFSSYELPGGQKLPFEDQVLFDNVTASYAGDTTTKVTVSLPAACGWQADLYLGAVIAVLHPAYGHPGSKLIDWSLNETGEDCDEVVHVATPLAPSVSDATCEAPGTMTLTVVEGISYTIEPAYTVGDSGEFTVTATADEGWTIAGEAQTVFEVTVPAAMDCPENAATISLSVSGPTCAAAGSLSINAGTGVMYTVAPAYTAGASGTFTVDAMAEEGYVLTGESSFTVEVPARKVCNDGTQGGNPTPPSLPNTALAGQSGPTLGVGAALLAIASILVLAGVRLVEGKSRW